MTAGRTDRYRWWLSSGMAEEAGVSLAGEVAQGRIGSDFVEDMVARCTRCQRADRCLRWRLDVPDHRGRVPDYCLNREAIETLL